MKEFEFIANLQQKFGGGITGIGDDAVLFNKNILIAKDILVEGVHFLYSTPIDFVIGKLFTCNISDIAAMGGYAESVLIGVACSKEKLSEILYAIEKYSKIYDVTVIGGDTSLSKGDMFLSMTVIGKRGKNILTRTGAKIGDIIYLSRPVGFAKISLEKEISGIGNDDERYFHYSLRAETKVGEFLGNFRGIGACCDISDGLGRDLSSIAKSSGVKTVIEITPLHLKHLEGQCSKQEEYFLRSGEEFALVFTIDKTKQVEFETSFLQTFGKKPIEIGFCEEGQGAVLRKNGVDMDIAFMGFEHF